MKKQIKSGTKTQTKKENKKVEKNEVKKTKKQVPLRDENEVKVIQTKLNRIAGLVGGIKNMVEDDRNTNDILVQLSAVSSILNSVKHEFLKEIMQNEISSKFKADDKTGYEDVITLIKRYL